MTCAVDDVILFTESYHRRRVNAVDLRHSRYDPDLQMFVEPSRDPDMDRLWFLRWLVERRLLEHGPAGVPCGDFTVRSARSGPSMDDRRAA
jgi:hypothetical protein